MIRRAIVVTAILVVTLVAALLLRDNQSSDTIEFAGMDLTQSELRQMTKASMGVSRLSALKNVGPDDRKNELKPRIEVRFQAPPFA